MTDLAPLVDDLTDAIRKVHDFLSVGAPAPLQEACAVGIQELDQGYYDAMIDDYRVRREVLYEGLIAAGFECRKPQGAYYVLADFSALSDEPSDAFSRRLTREAGVTPVPGSSFYSDPDLGHSLVRFVFCKKVETLEAASERLRAFARSGA